jgi:indole-3-glycerol phosphate synthase/phosphoribosylanthranilate isomerase
MTVLERILARTRSDLAERVARRPRRELERAVVPSDRSFFDALGGPRQHQAGEVADGSCFGVPGPGLIAEFKPASPSRGAIRPDADPLRYAQAYGARAAAISVLTEGPHFGGSHRLLEVFRGATSRPLLCKDFVVDPYQIVEARAHGADAVLLLASVHGVEALRALLGEARGLGMEALVEAHDEREIDAALEAGARVIGVNARDLRTLQVNPAGILPLLERIPRAARRVAESGVAHRAQVEALRGVADAVLIGTALMEAESPEGAMERLGW